MPRKNVEIINDTNYRITERNHPEKKKRRVFGSIVALVISLLLALFMRYYIEKSGIADSKDNAGEATAVAQCQQENAIV